LLCLLSSRLILYSKYSILSRSRSLS
jgi:hypothetical protein